MAKLAEKAGWDGFFLWDHIYAHIMKETNVLDPWTILIAIASHMKKIRIGTTVTPLSRMQPWEVAKKTATIDQLSNGCLILGVGFGADPKEDFIPFGVEDDAKIRGEMLDESIEILQGLWSGEKFSFNGKHFHINDRQFLFKTIQQPRIPIWVGGT